jgi:hypothetical protein
MEHFKGPKGGGDGDQGVDDGSLLGMAIGVPAAILLWAAIVWLLFF